MQAENLRGMLGSCPLRIVTDDGAAYVVDHPESLLIADNEVTVVLQRGGVRRNVSLLIARIDRVESLRSLSREGIESLDDAAILALNQRAGHNFAWAAYSILATCLISVLVTGGKDPKGGDLSPTLVLVAVPGCLTFYFGLRHMILWTRMLGVECPRCLRPFNVSKARAWPGDVCKHCGYRLPNADGCRR